MMPTKGESKRIEKELTNQQEKQKQQLSQLKHVQQKLNEKKKGIYKKIIIDSFLKEFSNNYGDSFDYQSLINSISFNFSEDKAGNLLPAFGFNENRVIFKSDAKEEHQKFNENSYEDFITNEDMIDGTNVSRYLFNSSEEYEAYEEGDIDDSDLDDLDGQFITIADNKSRYGNFNRINKLVGYTPTGESAKSATKSAIKKWSKLNK